MSRPRGRNLAEMVAADKSRAMQRAEAGLPPHQSKAAKRRERWAAAEAARVAAGLPAVKPRNTYDTYISSSWWVNRRKAYFTTHEKKCAGCGATEGIQLHHKTYARKGAELDADLVPVCQPCHKSIGAYHKAKQSGSLATNTDIVLKHVRTTGEAGTNPLETPAQRGRRRKKEAEEAGDTSRRTNQGRRYDAYIESDVWAQRRREYFETFEPKCEGCGTTGGITLHHKTYARSGRGRELDTDLASVCWACHSAIHAYHKLRLGRLEHATDTVLSHIRKTGQPGTHPPTDQRKRVRSKRRKGKTLE